MSSFPFEGALIAQDDIDLQGLAADPGNDQKLVYSIGDGGLYLIDNAEPVWQSQFAVVAVPSASHLDNRRGGPGAIVNVGESNSPGGAWEWSSTNTYAALTDAEGYMWVAASSGGFWIRQLTETRTVTPQMFGAVGDAVNDDSAAFDAMLAFAFAQKCDIYLPPTSPKAYRLTRTWNVGPAYVFAESFAAAEVSDNPVQTAARAAWNVAHGLDPEDETSPNSSYQQLLVGAGLGRVRIHGAGAKTVIWGDFDTEEGALTPIISYNVIDEGNQPGQLTGHVGGFVIHSKEAFGEGGVWPGTFGASENVGILDPANFQVGLFIPPRAGHKLRVDDIVIHGTRVGLLCGSGYWSDVSFIKAWRCQRAFVWLDANATEFRQLLAYSSDNGFVFEGESFAVRGCHTQLCAVDLILSGDTPKVDTCYFENTLNAFTDYSVKIGRGLVTLGDDPNQPSATHVLLENVHIGRYGGGFLLLNGASNTTLISCRAYTGEEPGSGGGVTLEEVPSSATAINCAMGAVTEAAGREGYQWFEVGNSRTAAFGIGGPADEGPDDESGKGLQRIAFFQAENTATTIAAGAVGVVSIPLPGAKLEDFYEVIPFSVPTWGFFEVVRPPSGNTTGGGRVDMVLRNLDASPQSPNGAWRIRQVRATI